MAATSKTREALAQMFIAALKEDRIPWAAGWNDRPMNGATGKPYRGINRALLSQLAEDRGYEDVRWCTYKQAQDNGWQVRKGEKGTPVEYWAFYDQQQKKLLDWKEARKIEKEDPDYARDNLLLRCRTSFVFNAQQMDGVPPMAHFQADIESIRAQRDTLIRNMGVGYREGGSQAYYSPSTDTVVLPPEGSFKDTYSYFSTLLHECGHASGHESRLNRDLSGSFGSPDYAREELRAEIGSAFTAQALGLRLTDQQLQQHMDLHKAYIQSWADALEDNPDELFAAIKDAEKISDYLIEQGEFPEPEAVQDEQEATNEFEPGGAAVPEKKQSYLPAWARQDADGRAETVSSDFSKDALVQSGAGGGRPLVSPAFRTESWQPEEMEPNPAPSPEPEWEMEM